MVDQSTSDAELLSDYARSGSADAFGRIVERYAGFVHSAALRQVGTDAHLAEDVTQAVFLILWRRGRTLDPRRTMLTGWLLLTTRNVACNALRREWRLKRRERKVALMNSEQAGSQPAAQAASIRPVLDDALARLSEPDRDAILLRFFHAKSLREVGEAMGLSEAAATKRVSRAIGKLGEMLKRAGVTVPEEALVSALPVLVPGGAAPGGLISAIQSSIAGAASPGVAALAGTGAVSSASAKGWAIAAVVAVLIGTGAYVVRTVVSDSKQAAQAPAAPAATPPAPAAPPAAAAPAEARTITILAIDPTTNQPIPDATVNISRNNAKTTAKTDAQGKYVLTFPTTLTGVNAVVRVTAPGRVTMEIWWSPRSFRGNTPALCTVPLEAGTTIGGVVVDPMGNPLAGARLRISIDSPQDDAPHAVIDDEKLVTDGQGRWQVTDAPSKIEQIWVLAWHENFPGSQSESSPIVSVEKLREQALISTVRAVATKLAGVVLDPDGKPLPGATVVVANDRYDQTKVSAITDEQGRFEAAGFPRWTGAAIVRAPGFAPQLISMKPPEPSPPVEVRMVRPVKIEAQVVSPDGKPVAGATVDVERWREFRALEWKTRTDANGRFVWNEAPADEVQFNVRARGYMSVSGFPITAGGDPAKIIVYPPVRISGSVVDAETKQPIGVFKITEGVRWTGQADVSWQTHGARRLSNGRYEATLDRISNGTKLKVEADGYEPAESDLIDHTEGTITLDFELRKSATPGL
jgi:RNA polymerase sigma factor (sigma-70 family)